MPGARIDLRKLLTGAQLPALPQSAIRLLELSQNPDNGPEDFATPIEADPGLTGQVLRFVNSSYFGFVQEISSIRLAITLVGIRTIKNFALWSAVFSLLPNPKCGPFDLKNLWQDSLRRAIFARRFGRHMGLQEAEDLFAAALLQDMAVPLLAQELPGDYERLLNGRENGRCRLSDLEQDRYGWTHAEAGGLIAREWKLPDGFAHLVECHASFDAALAPGAANPADLAIALSSQLPSTCDTEWADKKQFIEGYQALSGKDASELNSVFHDVDQEFMDFAPVLKLAVPAQPLAKSLEAEGTLA